MHIEIKRRGAGEWEHFAAPSVRMNYLLFALLGPCGRLENVYPVAPERGIPPDASPVTLACYGHEEGDAQQAERLNVSSDDPWSFAEDMMIGEDHRYLCRWVVHDHRRAVLRAFDLHPEASIDDVDDAPVIEVSVRQDESLFRLLGRD